jgi:hypothetical protein
MRPLVAFEPVEGMRRDEPRRSANVKTQLSAARMR